MVWVERDVLTTFELDATAWFPLETGAALLGYRAGWAVVVRQLILGGPRARRSRGGFAPDGRWQAREIARRYALSGRTDSYLGELHSHPDGCLRLSPRDARTAARIAAARRARAPLPLFGLLAGEPGAWTFATWEYRAGRFVRCESRIPVGAQAGPPSFRLA